MADVFISYKQDERPVIERIATSLRAVGLSVWFDASMSAGETFNDEIDREARAAKAVLVCWSPGARDSRWVKAEAMIGFDQDKLVACYVAGPNGFLAPAPFNTSHTEDLRAWLSSPAEAPAGWKSVLRRAGRLCGRSDIESWGALAAQPSRRELRAWIAAHAASPLFESVEALLRAREADDTERARQDEEMRKRWPNDEANRRSSKEGERKVGEKEAKKTIWLVLPASILTSIALLTSIVILSGQQNIGVQASPAGSAPRARVPISAPQSATTPPPASSAQARNEPPIPVPEMVHIPGRNLEVSRYEVTFAQWDACVAAGGCNGYRPSDEGWGRGNRPVINVSWNDAQAYTQWLSQRTNQHYRLLTSAEWEFAARAGTTTDYSWGNESPVCDQNAGNGANNRYCTDDRSRPVGSFQPNGFGLFDVHGNVYEWVEDCSDPSCSTRGLRGGSWLDFPGSLRSAYHGMSNADGRVHINGFRVARTPSIVSH